MSIPGDDPAALLGRALETRRIHSAYLLTGTPPAPGEAALRFARALVCLGEGPERPCEACRECRRSRPGEEPIDLDAAGKSGPAFRHLGDHPDLFWIERGASDTRVGIGQVRGVQAALRLGSHEGGWRAVVVADAERLSPGAQNALLRLLEEPPERTCLLLVSTSASLLLATIRSRCQRIRFPQQGPLDLRGPGLDEDQQALVARLDGAAGLSPPALLDWAEEYRGDRASAAARVGVLLDVGGAWLHERMIHRVRAGDGAPTPVLDAARTLSECRRELEVRNANPQMVAERALLAVRGAARQTAGPPREESTPCGSTATAT